MLLVNREVGGIGIQLLWVIQVLDTSIAGLEIQIEPLEVQNAVRALSL